MGRLAALAGSACLLLSACGGSGRSAAQPPAKPLAGTIERSGTLPPVQPGDLAQPIARYRRHVRSELAAMLAELDHLRAAESSGDRPAAQHAWLAADARYESTGAAYGAFGDLDAAINGRPAGLPGGMRSADFTGLHRVERILWTSARVGAALGPTRRLGADVRRLRRRVHRMAIEPLEYALRAHEVLEDTLHLQLSGRASPWSGGALVALRANLRGTRVVLATVRGLIVRRDPAAWVRVEHRLHSLTTALAEIPGRHGTMPRWDRLPRAARERIAGKTAAAAEALAYVPELLDPRPLRPTKPALGEGA
jgi:iron uptake system EfeUOB component EfeO/EfeM